MTDTKNTDLPGALQIKAPNVEGSTMCIVRWLVETPAGWVGAWDRGALEWLTAAAPAAPAAPMSAQPSGWKLVPVEPSVEMRTAGADAAVLHSYSAFGVYAAMIAAAPTVPQAGAPAAKDSDAFDRHIDSNTECVNCGRRYGLHFGARCKDGGSILFAVAPPQAGAESYPQPAVAHRILRKNGSGQWVHDAKTWADGPAPAELVADVARHAGFYRIENAYAAPAAPMSAQPSRAQIRDVFLAHGFTVKEGQADLKEYVYDAAYALLALAAPQPPAAPRKRDPLQDFDSPHAKALMRAWEEGWEACRDADYVGEEAQNDAFNSSETVNRCIAEDQLHPASPHSASRPGAGCGERMDP